MTLKERLEKINTYIHIEDEIKMKNEETKMLNNEISEKKDNIQELDKEISAKKALLESLKIEAVELKNFINESFTKDFPKCDYTVGIKNLYIIGLNNKKYICNRTHTTDVSEWFTLATGNFNVETYKYYNVLNVQNNKYQYIYGYQYSHFDNPYYMSSMSPKFLGEKPEYEEHILNLYPELAYFANDQVPNTYLKKIYYEINDLSHKKLTR